eukprot:922387_1
MYTHWSGFCKSFRETYRETEDETREGLQQRHCQLYHYARSLYEAVEFFGSYLAPNETVYHGLGVVLHFSKYTAQFDQPLSTTPSRHKAHEFSRGIGVILSLRSTIKDDERDDEDDDLTGPKYLSVCWLSCFPQENEKLFYGAKFEIFDITEAETHTSHVDELKMFNMSQNTVSNEHVAWKSNE